MLDPFLKEGVSTSVHKTLLILMLNILLLIDDLLAFDVKGIDRGFLFRLAFVLFREIFLVENFDHIFEQMIVLFQLLCDLNHFCDFGIRG